MNIKSVIDSRIIGYLIILLFVILKIPHLDYPFIWDESWPYASAIHAMYQHGPSLLPDAIDPDLSRGHPTLFIFSVALWMKIFGTSFIAIHSFPLFISALFSVSIYEIGRKLFNPQVGFLALILIIFQQIFFVQSSLVLLEIALAFAGFMCLYFYSANNLKFLAISLLVLFFIKESGAILGLSLGIMSIIRWAIKDISLKEFIRHLGIFSIPIIAYILFFSIQKHMLGWYFFPYHMELVSITIPEIKAKIIAGITLISYADNRYLIRNTLILAFAALVVLRWDNFKHDIAKFSFAGFIYTKWSASKVFILTTILFIPIFLLLAGMNVFINRYYLIIFVPYLFLCAAFIDFLIRNFHPMLVIAFAVFISLSHVYTFKTSTEVGDNQIGAFDMMKTEQEMISFMESKYSYDTPISTNAFILRKQLEDPKTRYLKSDKSYTKVNWEVNNDTKVAVFSTKDPDFQIDKVKADSSYTLVKRFENGHAWAEIYERK